LEGARSVFSCKTKRLEGTTQEMMKSLSECRILSSGAGRRGPGEKGSCNVQMPLPLGTCPATTILVPLEEQATAPHAPKGGSAKSS
jgi:hypothetical protein